MDTSGTYTRSCTTPRRSSTRYWPSWSRAIVRGRPRRHRQLQREGHRRPRDLRRAAVRDQPAEAQVPRPDRRLREGRAARAYTDITGGVLQAVEYLNEKDPGRKTILVFSDLEEDLEEGYVRDIPLTMDGFEVVAVNVTKLRTDNVDPRAYMTRLETGRAASSPAAALARDQRPGPPRPHPRLRPAVAGIRASEWRFASSGQVAPDARASSDRGGRASQSAG